MRGYILINTEIGKSAEVVRRLRGISGIGMADAVTGPYDVIAVVNGVDANQVAKVVMNQVHGLTGIKSTLTCVGIDTD